MQLSCPLFGDYNVVMYGGAQQKLFPPAYLGIADMHHIQLGIIHIQDGVEVVDNGSTIPSTI